jgi:hypothetical protein
MPDFRNTYQIATQSIATTTKAIFAWDIDTNQRPKIGLDIFCQDPTGASMVTVQIRRRGTDDGTKSAAITWVPDNKSFTETPKTAGYTFSVQPTNDGTVVRTLIVPSNQRCFISGWPCKGGEKYTAFVTTTATVSVQGQAMVEE